MKKIVLSAVLALFAMLSFNQIAVASAPHATKPQLSQTKQTVAWPTDVLVENFSGQTVSVRFITVASDDEVVLYPYPASNYYAQLLDQYYAYNVRVMMWDSYDRLFYDQNVGSVKHITITAAANSEKLSAKNITITK